MNPEALLRKVKGIIYSGRTRHIIDRIGLDKLLFNPYWRLVHKFSGDVQSYTINGNRIEFKTETLTEFIRFQNLAGERAILEDFLKSLKPNDVVYDIGANVGTYTCFVSSKVGEKQTVAFEPEPQNVKRLHENLKVNNLNAEIIEVALSNASGTVDFALSGDETGEGEHAMATGQDTETIEVAMESGDSVIEQRELPTPTVLKIDVEGAEMSVLHGLQEAIQEHVRLIYLEVHPEKLPQFGDTVSEVEAFLENSGFDIEQLSERGNEIFIRAIK
ncbi:FkbM family methyltransferase [Natrinema saccharevitans]|uniref:FkbM family methyltransferase n=1 Tax=Natrinema saccharevitans TaxID=301967 RepID=UPI001FECD8B8|nr:FkbM family methyltransferase [Natrinema saccharevitans]